MPGQATHMGDAQELKDLLITLGWAGHSFSIQGSGPNTVSSNAHALANELALLFAAMGVELENLEGVASDDLASRFGRIMGLLVNRGSSAPQAQAEATLLQEYRAGRLPGIREFLVQPVEDGATSGTPNASSSGRVRTATSRSASLAGMSQV